MVAILKCLDPPNCTILITLFVASSLPYYSAEHSGRKVVVKAFVTKVDTVVGLVAFIVMEQNHAR